MKLIKTKRYVLMIVFFLMSIFLIGTVFAAEEPVSIDNNGSRLVAKHKDLSSPSYQWMIADALDSKYSNIDGAIGKYYEITKENEGKYIKVSVGGVESEPIGPIGKLVVMDIGKGAISLGTSYSGKDSDGNSVSGTHTATNIYVIVHKENGTKTENNISFSGNLPNAPFDVTLAGVNMGGTPTNHNQDPGSSGSNTPSTGEIRIPATSDAVKKVILRLRDENIVRYISYYNGGDTNTPATVASSLKITNINGDGEVEGGCLYVPVKLTPEEIEAFVNSKTNYNHWNAGIGGTDSRSLVQNLHIAGGKIQVVTTLGDNCTAIGAGGNGYCQMEISGGEVIAHCNGTGAAIGGGIGWNAAAGKADILITGGKIYAENHAKITAAKDGINHTVGGVAIGSGSTFHSSGSSGTVTITGGEVEAYGAYGNGIGGGNSSSYAGGGATINITGGTVKANSIGGGNSAKGAGGDATITIDNNANVRLTKEGTNCDFCGIGGGNSLSGNGGTATITVKSGTINSDGSIGGGTGGGTGNGGDATVNIYGGNLTAASIGGGTGSIGGHGGAAIVEVTDGFVETGSIGGGKTNNPNGQLGYAKATIKGGDIVGQFLMAAGGTEPCSFTMTGGTLHGVNTADTSKFIYAQQNGAAVYMDDPNGIVSISGGTIKDCSAKNGGAVYMTAGTFTLSGGTITDCHVTGNGGAVYLGGGQMTVAGGSIKANTAKNGAGAYVNASTPNDGVFVSGGEITDNIAEENGGGITINNGFYKMTGGAVEGNKSTNGSGGGIYVAANGVDVLVDIRSGSVSNNKAGISGGAIAVVGQNNGLENISVTVGVNEQHYDDQGNEVTCDHDYTAGGIVVKACPELKNNYATKNGGCIYITGGVKTMLNTYCLVEEGSSAADGKSKSNFMMVEGGTVNISTADGNTEDGGNSHGKITINNTIHVYAGDMDLYGSMTNPQILAPITVDVTTERGSYEDHRTSDGEYYKLQYFENFTDPDTGIPTGQYTVYQIKHGDSHEILLSIYEHEGYTIDGWWTSEFGDVPGSIEYLVNKSYVFTNESDENPGHLTLYARWLPVGYYVYFESGTTDSYRGEMAHVRYNYDTENMLPANEFFRPGWIFAGWDYDGEGDKELLADKATVKNLTTDRSVTLVAVWVLCDHKDELFSYSASGDTLTRSCYCEECTQTATLIAEDTVYVDNNTAPYEAEIRIVTNVKNGAQPNSWTLTPIYEGKKYNGNNFDSEEFLIGAGRYSVSITDGGETVTVNFEIKKATRDTPEKPRYESNETNQEITKGQIKIINPDDTTGGILQYKIVWHDDLGTSHEAFADLNTAITTGFTLTTNYTNYYVYVRYEEDDNHNASEWIRAESVLFYVGNVYIYINSEKGIEYSTTSEEAQRGLVIDVYASEGYYLFDTKVTDDNEATVIEEQVLRQRYYIANIPESTSAPINIYVTITGVKKEIQISANITEAEEFGTVKGMSALITRDSAYTVYFEIQNYDVYTNPKLVFNTLLPEKTTLIFVDKTTGTPVLWYYNVLNSTNEIALSQFVRMGSENTLFSVPASSIDTPLKYQVIIDFADSEGCSGENITTTFSADVSADDKSNGVPDFPASSLVSQLKDIASSSVVVTDSEEDTMQKNLHIEYLQITDNAIASKWNNRCGALLLTPLCELTEDARIEVIDHTGMKTTYYRNLSGQFIISLAGSQNEDLQITLLSDIFPNEQSEYTFRVELISSCSLAGLAPLNGIKVYDSKQLTFTKNTKDVEPSLKIDGDKNIYNVGDTVTVNIEYRNCPEYTVLVLRLLSKDTSVSLSSNTYVDTGWKQQSDTVEGDNYVPLGQNLTGSCCIVLELRDITGNVITSVPYYFVVCE